MSILAKAASMRLQVSDLAIERGGMTLASGLSFTLEQGQAIVVTGPNGAGKSTFLRVVAGLLPAAHGSVILEGGGDKFPAPGPASHLLGHLNALKPALTVKENLEFWRKFHGSDGLAIDAALAALRLDHVLDLPFGYLSAGQKRRVAAAKMLLSVRPIWILDEPTAALDESAALLFEALMQRHLDEGGLLIAATHRPLPLSGAQKIDLTYYTASRAREPAL